VLFEVTLKQRPRRFSRATSIIRRCLSSTSQRMDDRP